MQLPIDPRFICQRCEHKSPGPYHAGNPLRCKLDGETINEHFESGKCLADKFSPEAIAAAQRAEARKNLPCTHRGAEVDRIQCPTCSGTVMLKVFSCPKHDRCCIGRTVNEIQSCATCADHQPASE